MKKVIFLLFLFCMPFALAYNVSVETIITNADGTAKVGTFYGNFSIKDNVTGTLIFTNTSNITTDLNGRFHKIFDIPYFGNVTLNAKWHIYNDEGYSESTNWSFIGWVPYAINSMYLQGLSASDFASASELEQYLQNISAQAGYIFNQTNTSCPVNYYVYGYYSNGTAMCREDQTLAGGETDPKWIADRPNYINTTTLDNGTIIRTDNTSWINQSGLLLNWSDIIFVGDSSWNESYANDLYASIVALNQGLDLKFNISGGTINGDVIIYGNLSVIGSRTELNVTDLLINGSFTPQVDSVFDLGSDSMKWNSLYAVNVYATNLMNSTEVISLISALNNFSLSDIVSNIGNWSLDKTNYLTITALDNSTIIRVDNTSWINQSGLIQNWSEIISLDGNTSWNESYANTLYLTTIENSTIARAGSCPTGYVIQNTTTGGVECVVMTAASGYTLGTIVGFTTSSYDGNISNSTTLGYIRGDAICASEYVNSHFCLEVEILKTNEVFSTADYNGTYWMKKGAPGYTSEANDCSGFTTSSSLSLGAFWNYDLAGVGQGKLTNCEQSKKLACCGAP